MARSVWAILPEEIVELIINTQEPDARSWLASIISVASHEDLTKVVVDL
jgi:frataxin-like iron-binding protein CyaY